MRKGVNFNVFSPGSHTGYLLQVGWLMCILAAGQPAACFNFTCLDRVLGCPVLAGNVRFHALILSCSAEFTSERRTPAARE